jgi:hypothetical protein
MNPLKAMIIVGITTLLMPWARSNRNPTGRKVEVLSMAYLLYKKGKDRSKKL